jgi:S-adenosylmethionine hydrolase
VEAAWILKQNYCYFPEDSVFCCVVDPGVGSARKVLAVRTTRYSFIAPDNGLLWETLKLETVVACREIPIPPDASHTFHGRDVFARAAARVEQGEFETLGPQVHELQHLDLFLSGREGMVVRIDRFGNCITNLPPLNQEQYSVTIGALKKTMHFYPTYDTAVSDSPFLIEGSCQTLEISVKNGSANDILHLNPGNKIIME